MLVIFLYLHAGRPLRVIAFSSDTYCVLPFTLHTSLYFYLLPRLSYHKKVGAIRAPVLNPHPRVLKINPYSDHCVCIHTGSVSSGGSDKRGAGRGQGSRWTHRRHQMCRWEASRRPVHVSAEERCQGIGRECLNERSHGERHVFHFIVSVFQCVKNKMEWCNESYQHLQSALFLCFACD